MHELIFDLNIIISLSFLHTVVLDFDYKISYPADKDNIKEYTYKENVMEYEYVKVQQWSSQYHSGDSEIW